jgi:alpha-L-fucosidase
MKEIGAWLKVNGDAIYGTRPVAPYKDDQVVYTQKGAKAFAIYLPEKEGDGLPDRVFLAGLEPKPGSEIHLLGFKPALPWKVLANGTTAILVPGKVRQSPPCQNAFAFEFQLPDGK